MNARQTLDALKRALKLDPENQCLKSMITRLEIRYGLRPIKGEGFVLCLSTDNYIFSYGNSSKPIKGCAAVFDYEDAPNAKIRNIKELDKLDHDEIPLKDWLKTSALTRKALGYDKD